MSERFEIGSRSGRSRESSTDSGLEGTSHCVYRFTCAGPFVVNVFPRFMCVRACVRARVLQVCIIWTRTILGELECMCVCRCVCACIYECA